MLLPYKSSYKDDLRLFTNFDFENIPNNFIVRVKICKFPIGYYAYRLAGARVVDVQEFVIRSDYRRLRHGTEMLEHLLGQGADCARFILREDVELGACLFLRFNGFTGRLVGENYHFERRLR